MANWFKEEIDHVGNRLEQAIEKAAHEISTQRTLASVPGAATPCLLILAAFSGAALRELARRMLAMPVKTREEMVKAKSKRRARK